MDAACSLAAGATCLSDIEAMTAQEEIFGPGGGASDTTMLRVLDELAGRLRADGLPGRRLARATASARAIEMKHDPMNVCCRGQAAQQRQQLLAQRARHTAVRELPSCRVIVGVEFTTQTDRSVRP